jgi:hypothetical protein
MVGEVFLDQPGNYQLLEGSYKVNSIHIFKFGWRGGEEGTKGLSFVM